MILWNICKLLTMKIKNNLHSALVYFILIVVIAFLFNALILNNFNFQYTFEISLTEIIGLFLTIILALYIAHVVEAGREQKKAIESIVCNIIQSLLSECDEIQQNVYKNNLCYLQAIAFSKRVYLSIQDIGDIIQKAGVINNEVERLLKKLSQISSLKKVLSEIVYRANNPDKYMEVKNNICDISPFRAGQIQTKLASIKKDLYNIWLELSMSNR